jgi:hypothetical protein
VEEGVLDGVVGVAGGVSVELLDDIGNTLLISAMVCLVFPKTSFAAAMALS